MVRREQDKAELNRICGSISADLAFALNEDLTVMDRFRSGYPTPMVHGKPAFAFQPLVKVQPEYSSDG